MSYIDELRELAKLKEDGIITEEEFQKKKEELL
jgi:cytochrome c-type biogenesis protein CcmH/NrfG